jgi:hypothetical protein
VAPGDADRLAAEPVRTPAGAVEAAATHAAEAAPRRIPRDAAEMLRHGPPALLLGEIVAFDGASVACTGRGSRVWRWAQLLEGGAQAAGLVAGLEPGGPDATAVIAEMRDLRIAVVEHAGPVSFHAALERRVLGFWRCQVHARDAGGLSLCSGRVTVAPAGPAERDG